MNLLALFKKKDFPIENTEMLAFIQLCKDATDLYLTNPKESEYLFGKILIKTIKKNILLKDIPSIYYGLVGKTFLCILDRTNDEDFFQTLSTLSYYFLSKDIYSSKINKAYVDRILILNIGARSFCKTVAKATNEKLSYYVDFNDIHNLPKPLKYILLMEIFDFKNLNSSDKIPDILNRKEILDNFINKGVFSNICDKKDIYKKGKDLHNSILKYIESEIIKKDIVFLNKE